MSVDEEDTSLKEMVTKTLQNNGVLGKIQAQLRASVFLALEEEFKEKDVPLVSPSVKQLLGTREGALAAALVQDFLQSLNLDFSLSVFAPESGHSALWSFPGKDAMKKDLRLETKRDNGVPLLLEILRERESPRLSKNEEPKKPQETPLSTETLSIKQSVPSFDLQNEPRMGLNKIPVYLMGQNDFGKCNDSKEPNSIKSQHEENSEKTITNSKSSEEDKLESENSIAGIEKQYEDDFSSMSEKEGQDEDEDEEIEEDEDIDEDISDLINSSVSFGSDHTKDQSISQASDVPNYQEDL